MGSLTRQGDNGLYISVVIPAWNAEETIDRCLQATKDQTVPAGSYEIIVVDDGSSDDTGPKVLQHGVRLLSQERRGAAAARNYGARLAQGRVLVFTDSDCMPERHFLEEITAPLEDPAVAGVRGVYRTRQPGLVPRFVQMEYQHKYDRVRPLARIDFVDTYAAAYRREVFQANGGFDESFRSASVEDQEFSFRLAEQGHRLVFAPAAKVFHHHNRSVFAYVRRKFLIGYWKTLVLQRHPEFALHDTHTPATQRWQIILLAIGLPATLGTVWVPGAWLAVLALAALFLVTSLGELRTVAGGDRKVLVVAPFMILVRTMALAGGLIAGIVGARSGHQSTRQQDLRPGFTHWWIKRGLDLVISVIGLVAAAPLLPFLALAIKLDSPGPVFFIQERVGLEGKRFKMFKLRTMVADAESLLDQVLDRSRPEGRAFKIVNDPRVTRVGRILRHWSLDETPQLLNVLRGEMSLVGPRPEEPRVVEQYTERQRKRLTVRPGLTGPMQVSGRGLLNLDERVELEMDYISHYSLWADLRILAKTIGAVIGGEGAI